MTSTRHPLARSLPGPDPEIRACASCRSKIHKDATLCHECGSFSANWRNLLKYWSGVVGLIAFISSATLFIYQSVAVGQARLFGANVEVLDLNTFGTFTLFNGSPAEILVRRIKIEKHDDETGAPCDDLAPKCLELLYVVNHSVEPGATLRHDMIDWMNAQTHGTWGRIYGNKPGDYVFSLTADERKDLEGNIHDAHILTFLNTGGSSSDFLSDEAEGNAPFPCAIEVQYTVFRGNDFSHIVPCQAWARARSETQFPSTP